MFAPNPCTELAAGTLAFATVVTLALALALVPVFCSFFVLDLKIVKWRQRAPASQA